MPVLEARPRISTTTDGLSASAEFIDKAIDQDRRHRLDTDIFGGVRQDGVEELLEIYRDHAESTEPGYKTVGIEEATLNNALRFLEALPLDVPTPSPGAEADGHITLEWYRAPRRVLSVSITPTTEIHYAALLGDLVPVCGTVAFTEDVPPEVLRIIGRLYP